MLDDVNHAAHAMREPTPARPLYPSAPQALDIAVGQRIRMRRRRLGISQEVLAHHLALSFQQVQKYEKGANRVSASTLILIAHLLSTTVADLVGEAPGGAPVGGEALTTLLSSIQGQMLLDAAAEVPARLLPALTRIARDLAEIEQLAAA